MCKHTQHSFNAHFNFTQMDSKGNVTDRTYFFQRVQVNINSNLSSQFSGKAPQHFLFVYCLLIGPEVVEPADDALLQHFADMSEVHVVFQGVHATLKGCPGRIHVGDHGPNITNNGGENQNTHLEQRNPIIRRYPYGILRLLFCHGFTRKSNIRNKYSSSLTGGGVSPMVVSVRVDQYRQYM